MKNFTWNNFDGDFIEAVVYNEKTAAVNIPNRRFDDKEMLIPNMEKIALVPSSEFIMNYREEIETFVFQKNLDRMEKVYKKVIGGKAVNHTAMITALGKKSLGNSMIKAYQDILLDIGSDTFDFEEISPYAKPATVDLKKSVLKEVPLYPFQEEAVLALREHFVTQDKQKGMLVMPTGSGKTRTAVCFLLRHMISQGYQVIWLTHRHMLIDQTAEAFYNFSPLIKAGNPNASRFKMACVSGKHSSIRSTEKSDDLMIFSIQSVCRSLDYLRTALGKKVMIVVDEAHHTTAKSYQKTIAYICKRRKDAKLLGLTATPIRGTTDSIETGFLHQYYDKNIIYEIPMSTLIKQEVLASPKFERIQTNTDIETIMSIDEGKLIKRFGEIPATLADKIARSSSRNREIVDTYLENKERYGKTLIFALNAYHCYTLCKDLEEHGVKCGYIYSKNDDNAQKIKRFKEDEGKDGLDVLININILTEGSDVPDIETVFLTRPTQSEGLLLQMIGRGMRGKYAGGTEEVNIVDFNDNWDTFNGWLNPQFSFEATNPNQPKSVVRKAEESNKFSIPWSIIGAIYDAIRFTGDVQIQRTLALPLGWYPLLDQEGNDYTLLVFKEQLPGFINLLRDEKAIFEKKTLTTEAVIHKYFGGFEMPPDRNGIRLLLNNWFETGEKPHLFTIEGRKQIDPVLLAQRFKNENVGLEDIEIKLRAVYDVNQAIIANLYGDFDAYFNRVIDSIKYPTGIPSVSFTIEVIPVTLIPYQITPTYHLDELMDEVLEEMFDGHYGVAPMIEWTDKPYQSFYGLYFKNGLIRINKLLDSPEVGRETVKFLIYHELLHRDYWKHDKFFYAQEHKYPNYTEHNRFLDYTIENYKFEW